MSVLMDERWVLGSAEVTMLRGTAVLVVRDEDTEAVIDVHSCSININLDDADAVLTVGGDEGEPPTVVHVPVAVGPEVRQRVHESIGGTLFHIGESLCYPDTGINLDDLPGFRRVRKP